MVIANPRIHIICGVCGCNKDFTFKIDTSDCDIEGLIPPTIFITCNNCSTLTSLDEVIPEEQNQ